MANNCKISGLPASPGVASADLVEVVDVSNTANQATGENTRATVAQLAAAIGGGGGPGGSSGQVQYNNAGAFGGLASVPVASGGTGLTANGTALQVLRVNAAGTGLEYASVSGGGGTPGGTAGQIQVNSQGAFGGSDLSALIDTAVGGGVQGSILYRDSASWNDLGPGTAGQVLRSGGAAANPSWTAPGTTLTPQWAITGIAGQKTGTTPVTLFGGGAYSIAGSLTIPANRLVAGSVVRIAMFGDIAIFNGDTMTLTVKLGGSTVLTATSAAFPASSPGRQWQLRDCDLFILSGGAAGNLRGTGTFVAATTDTGTLAAMYMSTAGGGAASTAVTLDFTTALALDCLVSFSSTNANNLLRILGGAAIIFG